MNNQNNTNDLPFLPDLTIKNAVIRGRNFSGRERVVNGTVVNPAGKRNFLLMLDSETAEKLQSDGWNVKLGRNRQNPDEDPVPYISVDASWGVYPPAIWKKVPGGVPVKLEEEDMDALDRDQIMECHVVVHPRRFTAMGRSGVKAYLREMYIAVEPSPFADFFAVGEESGNGLF